MDEFINAGGHVLRMMLEQQRAEEERRRREEERKQQEEERRRRDQQYEEERRRREEEYRRRDQQYEEECRRREEERRRRDQQYEEECRRRDQQYEEECRRREEERRQREQYYQELLKNCSQQYSEQIKQLEKQYKKDSKERQELKKQYEKEHEQREQHYQELLRNCTQQHDEERKQHREEHETERKKLEQQHEEERKKFEEERKKLEEEAEKYKSADFEKWTILKNDDCINSLLNEIKDKYPGSEMEKLRAEARDKFGIDSDYFNLGVTGQSRVGKSTLINVLCGRDDYHEEAARIDINECTDDVEGYHHPVVKHLVLYDLPGTGTRTHRAETYFCDKRLYVFDCLLVVMAGGTFQNDLLLAKFAQDKGTPVVFVRNKFMDDFNNKQKDPKYKKMEEKEIIDDMLLTTKKHISKELDKTGIKNPNIFIIEAHSLRQLDGAKFEELDLLDYLSKLRHPHKDLSLEGLKPC